MIETDSFEQLVKAHLPSLYTYCLARTCDPHRAEELAQEALCRAYISFHSLKDRQSFFPWLVGIAKRCSWTWFRKARRDPLQQRTNESGTDPPDTIMDTGVTPSEQLDSEGRAE
ncbi:MAG: sigma factor [bacterium]